MSLEQARAYLPENHGEQGVDASVRGLLLESDSVHEVFCNPPSGSWTNFDIIDPREDMMFRWDHIPRVPSGVKRPDQVFQILDSNKIELLIIESKYSHRKLSESIGEQLVGYLNGIDTSDDDGFHGLRERPAWHQRSLESDSWSVIPESESDDVRYWYRDYDECTFSSGFAFACVDGSASKIEEQLDTVLSDSDIDIGLCVTWSNDYQYPELYIKPTDDARSTEMYERLLGAVSEMNRIETLE